MRYISLFSGIGGFEKAIDNLSLDLECVGYSEVDKHAIKVYEEHFTKHENLGDVTKITTSSLPDFDLLVGGFPCQSFSVAGKRRGFDDTRGTLFFDVARIVKEKKPQTVLLENVKGLLSHERGDTFRTILRVFDELGYDVEWQVLNSKDFGVPQSRERVFIIGYRRGECRSKIFPLTREARETVEARDVAGTLQAGYGKRDRTGGYIAETKKVIPVSGLDRVSKRQNGRRFKEDGEPSFTLTTQDRHGFYDGARIRMLTPTECERLQGFPDGWTEGISDTQRYKCLGNAVTVNVVEKLIDKITTYFHLDRTFKSI